MKLAFASQRGWLFYSKNISWRFHVLHFFSKLYTQIQELHTQNAKCLTCKIKHCIQNITNTCQQQTFANTFAIILIPVRLLCVTLCVVFCQKYIMILKTESKAENECMVLQIWCVVLVFECQVSEIVWQVKILCWKNWNHCDLNTDGNDIVVKMFVTFVTYTLLDTVSKQNSLKKILFSKIPQGENSHSWTNTKLWLNFPGWFECGKIKCL